MLIDGIALAETIYTDLRVRIERLRTAGIVPSLGVVLIGDNGPSQVYVERKQTKCDELGMTCTVHYLPADIPTAAVVEHLRMIQEPERAPHGLIVQLPLPKQLDLVTVLDAIDPERDVDTLTSINLGHLMRGTVPFLPPTPSGILFILEHYQIPLKGQHVVVIGAGELVGKPLIQLLIKHKATVSVLNSSTPDLADYTRRADIVISAVGKPGLIHGDMITDGCVVIDAGTSSIGDTTLGDVDIASVEPKARLLTPTPGGVGPLTVAKLLENTVIAAEKLL